MPNTISYYNTNALSFIENTINASMTDTLERFLTHVPAGSRILDFGCGSGRDTKVFLEKGYEVEAIDGSEELCKYASEYTGLQVRHMYFQDLNEVEKYDGIWACSSILHLNRKDLEDVFQRISMALKTDGVLYTSFKYGTFEGERNGRYFTDMTEETISDLLKEVGNLQIVDTWITGDVRPGRGEEKWLNLIIKKV